jgi:hypothetical protein
MFPFQQHYFLLFVRLGLSKSMLELISELPTPPSTDWRGDVTSSADSSMINHTPDCREKPPKPAALFQNTVKTRYDVFSSKIVSRKN